MASDPEYQEINRIQEMICRLVNHHLFRGVMDVDTWDYDTILECLQQAQSDLLFKAQLRQWYE